MAQWNIKHACGHTETHNLTGPGKDRQRRADWLSERDCGKCRDAAFEAARKAEHERAVIETEARALPVLTGSEKQVAWANTIRLQLIDQIPALTADWKSRGELSLTKYGEAAKPLADHALALLDVFAGRLYLETSASWWIEHRELKLSTLFNETLRNDPEAVRLGEALRDYAQSAKAAQEVH